jgi:hypothetical protein
VTGSVGKVTINGEPAARFYLCLRFYNGGSGSTRATTQTGQDGKYPVSNVPYLGPGQVYYVRYANQSDHDSLLSGWCTRVITEFGANSSVDAGDFDLGNVYESTPAPGDTVLLPVTFTWLKRTYSTSDSYELDLFNPSAPEPYFYTAPLGYVNQTTLTVLPPGFQFGPVYGWYMAVYSPDGGYGESYYYYEITFSGKSLKGNPTESGKICLVENPRLTFGSEEERPGKP